MTPTRSRATKATSGARAVSPHVVSQIVREVCCDCPVMSAGWLADDQSPPNQLGHLSGNRDALDLFGRHQGRGAHVVEHTIEDAQAPSLPDQQPGYVESLAPEFDILHSALDIRSNWPPRIRT